ncbi:MAG: proton-conducting transporter membrane subunit [Bacteroidales bacterium]|jgi:formate hydrogenlyase subunit 3/multisubunit Na+/H+ antiporter MnhD subunit|nr:proton-conducting transporter membrane subunit [Bacteroidales bacterium]MDD4740092.1 proton-conducting transporter membrane subunit [Bacteroidales bacterium]
MNIVLFKIAILLTFVLFLLPRKYQYYFGLVLHLAIIAITSIWIFNVLALSSTLTLPFIPFLGNTLSIIIDPLSAFFMLVINFTVLTGIIYAKGYLQPYYNKKSRAEMGWHFFNFLWLHISMLLVVIVRDGIAFLMIWEVMSLSSFFLVIFETEKKETIKIGINYLIQMHVGIVFLMVAFIVAFVQTNAEFSFDGLSVYFASHNPFWLFILFFVGFGIKAGFIPLHSWLPHAHPAAPSHVSGVMSGVMIKMGIYGILRVLLYIPHDLFNIGLFILIVSLATGLTGISLAIVQKDSKKILAYSSIENIGIIGTGIGLGVIGIAQNLPALAVLGFGGGILHILNHALFKSLLFYSVGSVYKQTHTRNIEQLGGLIKKMPKTALFFLLGVLAISGLPPFNGFISEFLIYSGIFKSLHAASLYTDIVLMCSFVGLAIIGGLAVFCFTKMFSVMFLGTARSSKVEHAAEVGTPMLIPDFLIGFLIIIIGFIPVIFMRLIASVVVLFSADLSAFQQIIPTLNHISLSSGIFIIIVGLVWLLRAWQQKQHIVKQNATWGCGYSGANPALHQYTATSYADNFVQLSSKIVNVKKSFKDFDEAEIFPQNREFITRSSDVFEDNLITRPGNKLLAWLEKIAIFQTGKIQHYLLYALVFLALIFLLSFFNLI